jgi:hypothetical protein
MNKHIPTFLLICITIFIQGCTFLSFVQDEPVDENRAGCSYYKGDATTRYGSFTQYAKMKGDGQGAHIYVGSELKKVKITCNAEKQEVLVN